ncbi:hypothetical protein OAQ99_07065 [Candidatus Kapabacteria bacterium]|nr:hypothetical protein [Candidatus Kapabacteria bacterium]
MKKVLVIAYYFPPSGGPGVQRVLKHIKYLKDFGWSPVVLTVSNGQFPARDESLLQEIPDDVEVHRTKIFEPYDIYRAFTGKKKGSAIDVNVIKKEGQKRSFTESIAEFIRATFFIPDARVGWLNSAVKKGSELIKEKNIEAIYSSSPPYTCSLIAKKLKKKFDLPWVAGFRDPWTGFISSPKRWLLPSAIDKRMEKNVFKSADSVECAWQGIIEDAINKYPELDRSKFHHVPNGFDSADFPTLKNVTEFNDKFTLTYTGSMYGRRNPEALFLALEELINEKLVDSNKISLQFIGRFGNEVKKMFESVTFSSSLVLLDYMAHKKSIEHLMRSDATLLIVDESKESEYIVPGKIYEYLGVGKPVFVISPETGAISQLIKETNGGLLAHQSNIPNIKANFLEYYSKWQKKEKLIEAKKEEIQQYERRNSTKKLSELLNN